MPVPDVRWLHRDRGKCLWTFSFCSNARSFDRPTAAKPGKKIKVPIFIRRKGADGFRPALAAGGSLMAYKCLSLCDFFIVQQFFKLCHISTTRLYFAPTVRNRSRVWGRHAPTRSLRKCRRIVEVKSRWNTTFSRIENLWPRDGSCPLPLRSKHVSDSYFRIVKTQK